MKGSVLLCLSGLGFVAGFLEVDRENFAAATLPPKPKPLPLCFLVADGARKCLWLARIDFPLSNLFLAPANLQPAFALNFDRALEVALR